MEKISEMIERLCPEGVEKVPLWKITAWDKKFNAVDNSMQKKIIKYNYFLAKELDELVDNSGDVRILYTTEDIAFTTEEKAIGKVSEGEVVTIPWGGNPTVKYYKGRFITGDNRIATSLDKSRLDNKYLYYWMLGQLDVISTYYRGAGIKHPSMFMVLTMEIPLPPLSIQQEIVRVLDSFTAMITNLETELASRQKQYEHYRNQLLTFDENDNEIEKIAIKDVFDTRNGYTPSTQNSSFWENGVFPWFKMEDIREKGQILSDSNLHITQSAIKGKGLFKANSIILATSATIGEHALITVEHLSNQRFTNFYPKKDYLDKIDMKYMHYYFYLIDRWCKDHTVQGNFAGVNMSELYNYMIPIPRSIDRQREIVSILDTFEALITNIKQELEARKKQYEYYREKLLTFE